MAFFASIGAGLSNLGTWFTTTPVGRLLGAALIAILAFETVKRELEKSGERKERARNDVAAANARAEVAQTQQQISQEQTNDQTRADAAVDALPTFTGPEQLRQQRPGLHSILFGNAAG